TVGSVVEMSQIENADIVERANWHASPRRHAPVQMRARAHRASFIAEAARRSSEPPNSGRSNRPRKGLLVMMPVASSSAETFAAAQHAYLVLSWNRIYFDLRFTPLPTAARVRLDDANLTIC